MLRLARPLANASKRQALHRSVPVQIRSYAERKDTILSSDPAFLPGSQSQSVPKKTEVPLGPAGPSSTINSQATPSTPSSGTVIPPENVPRIPPSPQQVKAVPPPPPPPPPPAPKPVVAPRRRFRRIRFLFYLLLASALGYGGAVFYALRSDNFHDFFTEYVPFGEDAVLYFEERSFRKRFPNARLNTYRSPSAPKTEDSKVTIPQKAGLSWKVSDQKSAGDNTESSGKGRHMSALDAEAPTKQEKGQAQRDPSGASAREKIGAVEAVKKDDDKKSGATPVTVSSEAAQPRKSTAEPPAKAAAAAAKADKAPVSEERKPAIPPVAQVSALEIKHAEEPLVKDLVKIINDLITVINADTADAANKYSAPMQKAKEALTSVAGQIGALKEEAKKAAEEQIAKAHKEFDEGAQNLVARIETAQRENDAKYREEFEAETARIAQQYEDRLKTEVQRTAEIAEQRLKNELAEQAISLKRNYISDVKSLVETERDGRLSKLSDLSSNVDNLTQLASNWNGIIDSNLATQKLQVAVDAVRSALAASNVESKPKPFVREMAALKLVAEGDPVVDAAVASINPAAYQKGIPSASQLIDRFRRVASEVRKASLLPEDAGIASHAASVVLSKVLFKKQGQPEGNDVESVLTRTETLLEEGDLDAAAREMNELQGWAGVLSKDWLNDARKVLEVRQALDVIETEARLQCLRVE